MFYYFYRWPPLSLSLPNFPDVYFLITFLLLLLSGRKKRSTARNKRRNRLITRDFSFHKFPIRISDAKGAHVQKWRRKNEWNLMANSKLKASMPFQRIYFSLSYDYDLYSFSMEKRKSTAIYRWGYRWERIKEITTINS